MIKSYKMYTEGLYHPKKEGLKKDLVFQVKEFNNGLTYHLYKFTFNEEHNSLISRRFVKYKSSNLDFETYEEAKKKILNSLGEGKYGMEIKEDPKSNIYAVYFECKKDYIHISIFECDYLSKEGKYLTNFGDSQKKMKFDQIELKKFKTLENAVYYCKNELNKCEL